MEDYEDPFYRASDRRLSYASTDALTFHGYVKAAWGGTDHTLLTNRRASLEAVRTSVADLARTGPFDLFFFYFSGHGERAPTGTAGWFCLADAKVSTPSLGQDTLGSLLESIESNRCVVIVDCCFAEAVVAGLPFFARLDDMTDVSTQKQGLIRLFVASARAYQRAWEDQALRRSIFSDVMMRALLPESEIASSDGYVDLETGLFPRLREQVPLTAAATKNGVAQEPVTGGVAAAPLRLPTVAGRYLGRPLSLAQTVRLRARAYFVRALLVLILTTLAIDSKFYHITATGTGEIKIRPGLGWTYDLMPFHVGRGADTGFILSDIQPANETLIKALNNNEIRGFSGHLDEQNLRPWLREIHSGLEKDKHASISALAMARIEPFVTHLDSPPLVEAGFLARELGKPIIDIANELYPLVYPTDEKKCDEPRANNWGQLVDSNERDFRNDALWFIGTAPTDTDRANALVGLAIYAAYRATSVQSDEVLEDQFRAFSKAGLWVVRSLGQLSADFSKELLVRGTAERLASLRRGLCADHALFTQATLPGQSAARMEAERRFLKLLQNLYADTSELREAPENKIALAALSQLSIAAPLGHETTAALVGLFQQDKADFASEKPASIGKRFFSSSPPVLAPSRVKFGLQSATHSKRVT